MKLSSCSRRTPFQQSTTRKTARRGTLVLPIVWWILQCDVNCDEHIHSQCPKLDSCSLFCDPHKDNRFGPIWAMTMKSERWRRTGDPLESVPLPWPPPPPVICDDRSGPVGLTGPLRSSPHPAPFSHACAGLSPVKKCWARGRCWEGHPSSHRDGLVLVVTSCHWASENSPSTVAYLV